MVIVPWRETVPNINPSADPRVASTRDVVSNKLVRRITTVLAKPVDP
jgi:hypothetical protein